MLIGSWETASLQSPVTDLPGLPDKATLTQSLRRGYLVSVEIADSARKHGVRDDDIDHAVRNPMRVVSGEGRYLVIGADGSGRLLEVVVLDDDPEEEPVVIHAMPL